MLLHRARRIEDIVDGGAADAGEFGGEFFEDFAARPLALVMGIVLGGDLRCLDGVEAQCLDRLRHMADLVAALARGNLDVAVAGGEARNHLRQGEERRHDEAVETADTAKMPPAVTSNNRTV